MAPARRRGRAAPWPIVAWSVGLAAVGVAGLAAGAEPASFVGAAVVSVEVHAGMVLGAKERDEIATLLVAKAGLPLDPVEVRRSLRNLQASGLVGEAEARAVVQDHGVRLLFAVGPRIRVSTVAITGNLGLRRSELESALPQQEAAPLSENRILRGVYALQDLLAEKGFLQAAVRVDVQAPPGTKGVAVTYEIEAGPRTRIGKVRFEGVPETLDRDALLSRLRLGPGAALEASRLEDDQERLEEALVAAGFRMAEVQGPRREAVAESIDVDLVYTVEAGPRFELEVLGADVEALRRRGLLSDLERRRYDEALLLQAVKNIRRDYQARGHYRAVIDYEVVAEDGVFRVSLDIAPGPVFELRSVRLEGNQWATEADLLERMSTAAGRTLFSGTARLVDELLREDIANLESFYALQGFREASVGPPRVEERGSSLEVTLPIVEGPQQRVVQLGIEGLDTAATGVEAGGLAVRPGGPFHPRRLEEATEELLARLEDAGYLSAQVRPRLEWNDAETLATIHFEVLPGPRVTVDRVVLRGGRRTDPQLIRRTLGLEPGDPLSRRAILEAQRRLYRLGIFARAQVRMAPAPPFSPRRDVLVSVSEGTERRLTYGAGYDSEDGPRGLLGFSRVNIFGRGVAARFDLRLSTREQQVRALVRQPMLGRRSIPVTYSLFAVEEDQRSFDSLRRGFQVEAEHQRGAIERALLYTYKRVEVENPDEALVELEIDRDLAEVQISSLTPSLFIDRRDDLLLPERGWTLRLQTEYAFPLLRADAEFLKLFTQQTAYVPLGGVGTLASSLRLGAIEPVGSAGVEDPTLPAELPSRLIPISERFFAGGRTSHRAYRRDRLGVIDRTLLEIKETDDSNTRRLVPVGGNGLLLVNLEVRFPIAGPLGGTAFVDAGNVWSDWRDLDLSELKKGAGFGLRYLSPIGPLRLEVGWKLDREAGEDPAVIFLSFGNPF